MKSTSLNCCCKIILGLWTKVCLISLNTKQDISINNLGSLYENVWTFEIQYIIYKNTTKRHKSRQKNINTNLVNPKMMDGKIRILINNVFMQI